MKSSCPVILTRCEDYTPANVDAAVARQFAMLGGLGQRIRPGDFVLIKPNFIAPRSHRHATQTHPVVIIAIAKILKDFGARPFVADSPAWSTVNACAAALKLDEPLRKMDVPIMAMKDPVRCDIDGMNVRISSVALDADAIINVPKFKSHQQLVATFAVKNMFGCVAGKRKAWWHFARGGTEEDFCKLLIGIYRRLNPVATIIDGIFAMDGPGPIRGRTRPFGWLIGSTDPTAAELACCKLIKLNPQKLPIVRTAQQLEFGCTDMNCIQILGDDFTPHICTDFVIPELIPIRFSLTHVCKSIAKQIMLLLKIKKIPPGESNY